MRLHDIKRRVYGWLMTERVIRRLHQLDNRLPADIGLAAGIAFGIDPEKQSR